jgi:hypothetical protein
MKSISVVDSESTLGPQATLMQSSFRAEMLGAEVHAPAAPPQTVRGYAYVFGAVSPADGRHDSLVLPWPTPRPCSCS